MDGEHLKINPILASLSDSALEQLAEKAELCTFGQGVGIAGGTDSGNEIYLILEGQAQIQIVLNQPGHPDDTLLYSRGDLVAVTRYFGEAFPHDAVISNTDIQALRWQTSDWQAIGETDPASGYQLAMGAAKLVLQRIRAISDNPGLK